MPLGKSVKIYPARPVGVCTLNANVWEARVNRADLEKEFGDGKSADGTANILLTVAADVRRVDDLYELELDPELSWLVDVHDYPWVLIVNTEAELWHYDVTTLRADTEALDAALRRQPIPEMPSSGDAMSLLGLTPPPSQSRFDGGDRKFIQKLPEELRVLGEAILETVRSKQAGRLRYYSNAGRFVETPDNWWTVKIQPRAKSLAFTIRGLPESFSCDDADFKVSASDDGKSVVIRPSAAPADGELELKRDRGNNSRFTVKHQSQLKAAIRVLEWAAKGRRR